MPPEDHSADHLFDKPEEDPFDLAEEGWDMVNALDAEILMHRDAHFSGNFDLMIDYYHKGGKGINPEFEPSRIEELAKVEKQSGENMATLLLAGSDAERVGRARAAYRKLRDACESTKHTHAKLLASLILSEDDESEKGIQAVIAEGPAIVPPLLALIQSPDFYDPLFPGYGLAPILAAHCLGKLRDKRAITTLFEAIGRGDFFQEDTLCHALNEIGDPAKQFLLKVIHSRPLNDDNERAAMALDYFSEDPEVSRACLAQLQDKEVLKHETLATYLTLACSGLATPTDQAAFRALANRPEISSTLKRDIATIAKAWG